MLIRGDTVHLLYIEVNHYAMILPTITALYDGERKILVGHVEIIRRLTSSRQGDRCRRCADLPRHGLSESCDNKPSSQHRGRGVTLNTTRSGHPSSKTRPGSTSERCQATERLVQPHQIEIDVGRDAADGEHLIEHLTVLGANTDLHGSIGPGRESRNDGNSLIAAGRVPKTTRIFLGPTPSTLPLLRSTA